MCAFTVVRPVMGAILPVVTHTPRDLIAANVVSNLNEQIGRCLGPLVAGLLIAIRSPALVMWVCGAGLLLGALAVARVSVDRVEPSTMHASDVVGEVLGGFRALRREVVVRWLIATVSVGVLVVGAIDILVVTFAIERLGSQGEAGLLQGGFGAGALIGAAAGTGLVGGARVLRFLVVATILLAAPFLAVGAMHSGVGAVVVFATIGAGMSLVRFVAMVALQRLAPLRVLTRIFGVLESLTALCLAIGSVAIAQLIAATSLGRGSVIFGVAAAAALSVCLIRLGWLGAGAAPPPAELFDRIVGDRLFAPLPVPTIERLAAAAAFRETRPGQAIITEGEPGDGYFLIVDGEVVVTQLGDELRRMGPGESFGEIALLRQCARTATVTAIGDVGLYTINRADFLQAVTGHPRSLAAADEIATDRLRADRREP